MIGEEFRKLDRQLNQARADLEERHRRELELERVLQRADRLADHLERWLPDSRMKSGRRWERQRVRAEALQDDEAMPEDSRVKLGIIMRQINRISRG